MRHLPRPRAIVAVAGLALVVSGCGAVASPSPVRSLGTGEVAVPTFSTAGFLCAGGGFVETFVLHGDPSDPRVTWLAGPNGERKEIAWLPGSSARFDPELEVLDPTGRVIAREGSIGQGSCPSPNPKVLYVDFETPAPEVTEPPMTAEP